MSSFESPEKSAYGGGNRKPYDEQNLIPVTIRMLLNATSTTNSGGTGQLALPDGRDISTIKFIGAVRNAEEQSTHVRYEIEDGTGLIEVKQFIDESTDNSFTRDEREKIISGDGLYVRVIGQLKDFNDSNSVVAFSVRTISTGNELTHHMLEVVYSGEKYKRDHGGAIGSSGMMPNPFGTNAPLSSPVPTNANNLSMMGGSAPLNLQQNSSNDPNQTMYDTVLQFIRDHDEEDLGTEISKCINDLQYSEAQIRESIDWLSSQGLVYSTVDETRFKFAELY